MVKLSKRLETVASFVSKGSVVADVGSDHGKLMIYLFENGIINHGYAIENKIGPYNRLKKALMEADIIDDVVPLLSDGISELPPSVNTVVLAGMGGSLILDILKKNAAKLKNVSTLIVDAHNAVPSLREGVIKLGYAIADEKIIKEDDIFYEVIKFIKSDIAFLNDKDIEFGPILRQQKSMTFKEKYSNRIKEIDQILKNSQLPENRIVQLNNEKKKIEGIL